ncbi:MAG: hypothetical protein HDR95_08935 [Bacteroides sp.]|nr:hypothetical protein [Bacteroidales bacterium]MBD5283959.1 hypothetical protein [Bacteroides sp.]MBD5337410.1 hypothetical protein [Bacteroides sp.]
MDNKEKDVRENRDVRAEETANSLPANGKNRKRNSTVRTNKLWMWLGIIVLVFILLYWLFAIGTFEDMMGVFNG